MNAVTTDTRAAQIQAHHDAAYNAADKAIEHAKQAGVLLLEVKASLPHGEFTKWVDVHLTVSQRQAQRYMAAAQGKALSMRKVKEALPAHAKNDTVSHLPGWLPKGGDMALCVLNWIDTDMPSEFVEVQQVAHAHGYYYIACLIGSTLDWTSRGVRADYVEEYIRDCLPGRAIKGKEISDLPWESGPADPNYLYDATIKPFNQLERSEEAAAFAKRRRAA